MDPLDPDDTPCLAVAIALGAAGIWTADSHFRRQTRVPVLSTRYLLSFVELEGLS